MGQNWVCLPLGEQIPLEEGYGHGRESCGLDATVFCGSPHVPNLRPLPLRALA